MDIIEIIIKAAEVVGSLGCLAGLIAAFVKFVQHDKEQSKLIRKIQKEQTLICWGLKGALQGLIESGCNGPCKEALQKLEEHLNEAAHGEGANNG